MDLAVRATLTSSRVSRDRMNDDLLTMVYPEHPGA